MKTILIIAMLCWISFNGTAQNRIAVCKSKVSHLIAREGISYVQVGDAEKISAEQVPEHPNMVRIKAVADFEGESSLTVVSAGRAYSLLVEYADTGSIAHQLSDFSWEQAHVPGVGSTPEYLLKEYCHHILQRNKRPLFNVRSKAEGMRLTVRNVFLKYDRLFFEIELHNRTQLDYEVETMFWWIADRKITRATNVQEYQVEAEYAHHRLQTIPGKSRVREVIVLPRLTIPEKRTLRLEVLEKALGNTGRKLQVQLNNKHILKARTR